MATATRRARRGERGVTVLELVIAMALLAIVVGSIYSLIATGARSARVANDMVQTQSQVRAALDNLVDEARWAQAVVVASSTSMTLLVPQATPFAAGSPYTVAFAYDAVNRTVTRQVDVDASGPSPPGPAEPVAYRVVGGDGSDGFALEYFDAAGASLGSAPSDLAAIARVRITVTTTWDRFSRTFAGDAALRAR
jgi:prepilin-type N-terminal cleavage/methylation domain-containing protein